MENNESAILDAIKAVGQDPKMLLDKVKSLLRRIEAQFPGGSSKSIAICKNWVAVELACRMENLSFRKNSFGKNAGISDREYQKSYLVIKNALNIKLVAPPTIELLALKFGTTFKASAYKILDQYQLQYVSKLAIAVQQGIDLNSPVYHAAAFYVSLRNNKVF